jgi:type I restriction enzyme S subunit
MSDELFELPEGWIWSTWEEIGFCQNGRAFPSKEYQLSGVKLLRPGNMHDSGKLVWTDENTRYMPEQWEIDFPSYIVRGRELVVNLTAQSLKDEFLGRICLTDESEHCLLNQRIARLTPVEVFPEYILWLFKSKLFRNYVDSLNTGSLIQHMFTSQVEKFKLPLAPLNQQKRIVAKIEELRDCHQRAKQALEAIPELCDRFRQSVLAAAFRGDLTADWREENPDVEPASALLERIRRDRRHYWEETELSKLTVKGKIPKDDKWKAKYQPPQGVDTSVLPELPDNWCWASAEELTAPGRTILYGIIKPGPDTPDGVPYVRVNEMKNGTIDVTCLRKCHPDRAALFSRAILRAGDILISKDGTIGKVALVPPELEGGNITQHVLRFSPSEHISELFISRMIEAPFSQNWILSQLKGIGLLGINVEDFRKLPIPLPPLSEQIIIHELLSVYLEKISILKDCRDTADYQLNLINQSILAKAFRGELVEQDPNDEPASVLLDLIRTEREKTGGEKKTKGKRAKQLKLEV